MKFGKRLRGSIVPEWRFYYIDYDGLKRMIKERTATGGFFAENEEAMFIGALETELEKVIDFRNVKAGELTRHVQYCENVVRRLAPDDQTGRLTIEPEITRITQELAQLSSFVRLNHTGFLKILKKHDKRTEYMLRPTFLLRLNARPLELENIDALVVRLSRLYDMLRSDGPSSFKSHSNGGDPVGAVSSSSQIFVRKTTKYWVHSDNVTDVKCIILQHLPVLVYGRINNGLDLAVSSVYLDNENLDLYHGRLEKKEGAMAIRLRWYGKGNPQEVFIERKVHREDWTGEMSVKARFSLKEPLVNDYLTGELSPDDIARRVKREQPDCTQAELEEIAILAGEIQESIRTMSLVPKLRTFYHRTAFQLPGDARVRISLDTELTMIREDGKERSGSNWCRKDLGEYPFNLHESTEKAQFPHAILEVKLQTQAGQDPPKWVQKLVAGNLVEEVPKFSKFIHGCATLLESQTRLHPFWLPQMNVDIRKKGEGRLGVSGGDGGDDDEDYDDNEVASEGDDDSYEKGGSREESKRKQSEQLNQFEGKQPTIPSRSSSNHVILNFNEEKTNEINQAERSTSETEPLIPGQPHRKRKSLLERILGGKISFRRIYPHTCSNDLSSNPTGSLPSTEKRIHVPVRVEPKVYFANERTFLSWIHFSIFLGGISTALIGLGDRKARLSGYLFAVVSVLFSIYALQLFRWRASRIRERDPGPYDDRFGPNIVVITFLLAMVVNVIVTLSN